MAKKQKIKKAESEKGNLNKEQKYNDFAIAGLVCAFFMPLLGLIFSIIALVQIKRTGEQGHGLALAGLIISIFFFALIFIVAIVFLIAFGVLSPQITANTIIEKIPRIPFHK